MRTSLEELLKITNEERAVHSPFFYRLSIPDDKAKFEELLQLPGLRVSDELHVQLRELVKLLAPSRKFTSAELDLAAVEHLGNIPPEEYGVWVYYPWSRYLVHLLDEDEFRTVRTNRNVYKITPAERDLLSQKKIGVIGLSVGQSVALTLAMERSFGELRLADFDILELSNLNRIRSGTHDLGILKTVSTARQIAEIDPFLKVTCFHDGLNEANMDSFFTGGGKLDVLIDECDGLDIKILARLKARELGVPVLMETSDRGMVDVERFDKEPNRPILHGLIEHLDQDTSKMKGLTNEQKVPYILPMLGLDTMSDRLKASMLEVEESITTWPQLASDVVLGGAISANVCRRIFLDQFNSSGRYFADMNQIVAEDSAYVFVKEEQADIVVAEDEEAEVNDSALFHIEGQLSLSEETITELVEAAIWAPTGGNSQPWKWLYQNNVLFLLIDQARATSFLDFRSAGAFLGLGAATENLVLKAHQLGYEVHVKKFPEANNDKLVASFHFFRSADDTYLPLAPKAFDSLAEVIRKRETNRLLRKRVPLEAGVVSSLKETAASVPGVELLLIEDDKQLNAVGAMIAQADRILVTHKHGHYGFVHEIRWSDEEAKRTGDGVDLATLDLSAGEAAGFKMARNWSVVKTLNQWGGGSVFEQSSKKAVAGASALGLITLPELNEKNYYEAGKAIERVWLQCTKSNIAFQPMTGLTFMVYRAIDGKGEDLTDKNISTLIELSKELRQTFGVADDRKPAFLFRIFIAEEARVKAYRRPVADVLTVKVGANA